MIIQALLLSVAVLTGGPTYKCKDANGAWTEQACPDYPKRLAELERDARQNADFDALAGVWAKICKSSGDGEAEPCIKRQRADYRFMTIEIEVARGDLEKTAKMVECAANSNDRQAGGMNATLWRYCYFH